MRTLLDEMFDEDVWAFYLTNGNIERRKLKGEKCEAQLAYTLDHYNNMDMRTKVLQVVRKSQEKDQHICPKNADMHHFVRKCKSCGAANEIDRGELIPNEPLIYEVSNTLRATS